MSASASWSFRKPAEPPEPAGGATSLLGITSRSTTPINARSTTPIAGRKSDPILKPDSTSRSTTPINARKEVEPIRSSITSRSTTPTEARKLAESASRASLTSRSSTPTAARDRARTVPAVTDENLEFEKVTAWQSNVDELEQMQLQIQQDHVNLLHNQIHIFTRELGDLQKAFGQFQIDMSAVQEEAHAALRLELADHGSNVAEMKAAWEEAHGALSRAMDDGLGNMAADHAKALEDHKAEHAKALADHAENLNNHGSNLSDLEDLHNRRYEEHTASLEKGLEGVHGTLQKELAELRSGHAVNLQQVVTDVTDQVDKLTVDVEQMAADLKATQEEAHSALRLELAEHGNNASEMKAAWEEAHKALSMSMDDNLASLADQHAKALDDHKAENAQALSDHADNLNNCGSNLSSLEDIHNQRYEEHSACLEKGLEDVHGTLQKELAELRSGHAVNLQKVVEEVTAQVDKLTIDVEQMANDLKTATEEAHSALRLELAEHGSSAEEMKAAWEEAHKALSASLDDNLASLADQHARALDDHKAEQSQMFSDHAENLAGQGSNLSDLEDLHNQRYEEHSATLQKGLEDVHGTLQKELAEFRSGHAVNLQKIVEDITVQVDKLTLDLEELGTDVRNAQEEAHAALRVELAEHGTNAAEMKAAWDEAHRALAQTMDDGLGNLAAEHARALDDHRAEQSQVLADHAANSGSSLTEITDLHNKRYEEHAACLEQGLEDVHGTLQKELAELRSGHAVNIRQVLTDVTAQVDKLALDVEELGRDVKTAHEEAHSALRIELAEHGTNMGEMKAAWEEAHNVLAQAMDDGLGNLAADHAKALESNSAEQANMAKALAAHAENHSSTAAEIQAQLRGEIEVHARNLQDLSATYDAKHAEHDERYNANTAKMEAGLQNVLENTHGRLQSELAELKSGHVFNLQALLQDLTEQVDTVTLSLEQEGELRKIMEVKLDKLFEGMRGLMAVSFLGEFEEDQQPASNQQADPPTPAKSTKPAAVPQTASKQQPEVRSKSPPLSRGTQQSASGQQPENRSVSPLLRAAQSASGQQPTNRSVSPVLRAGQQSTSRQQPESRNVSPFLRGGQQSDARSTSPPVQASQKPSSAQKQSETSKSPSRVGQQPVRGPTPEARSKSPTAKLPVPVPVPAISQQRPTTNFNFGKNPAFAGRF